MAFTDEHNLQVKAVGEANYKIPKEFLYVLVMILALIFQYVLTIYFVTMRVRITVFRRKFMC